MSKLILTDLIDVGTMLDDTYVKYTDNFNKKTRRYATNDRAIDRHLSTMWESMADCIEVFTETEKPSVKKKEAKEKFDTARAKMVDTQKAQVTTLITEVVAGIMPAILKQTTGIIKEMKKEADIDRKLFIENSGIHAEGKEESK